MVKIENDEEVTPDTSRFLLVGNSLCIDFANTIYSPSDPTGTLHSWFDLVDFMEVTVTASQQELAQLRALGKKQPRVCADVFAQALVLRDALRNILREIVTKQRILPVWIMSVNSILRANERYERLVPFGDKWRITYVTSSKQPERALAIIASSAADLIDSSSHSLIRKCANPECVLYFYDNSRTSRRRWCSMDVCGNRTKVAAYIRRRNLRQSLDKS
jgi:predicted RNA-binding Zn ribbon-like protein